MSKPLGSGILWVWDMKFRCWRSHGPSVRRIVSWGRIKFGSEWESGRARGGRKWCWSVVRLRESMGKDMVVWPPLGLSVTSRSRISTFWTPGGKGVL